MADEAYENYDKGYTSTIYRISGTRKVCKVFFEECQKTHFPAEKEAYERFTARGSPPSILKYYGVDKNHPASLVLELAETGNLYHYLWQHHTKPSRENLYRWARQAAEGLAFAHSCGVFHSDIHCSNLLLDENFDLKVADFAGASIDGSTPWSFYRVDHQLPDPDGKDRRTMTITTESEIFALGSAFYYMVVGDNIFPELDYSKDQVELVRRLREKEFPNTSHLSILGSVITKCWNLEYNSMIDVSNAIKAESNANIKL